YLERYFERTNNHYVFQRDLRKCVIFGRHNVVNDAPISRIDLLVCRNLLIYLESETQDIVLPRLHYALARDGFLFLGKAETQLARSALFNPVEMKHRIFTKVPQEWRRPLGGAFGSSMGVRAEPSPTHPRLFEVVLNEASTAYLVVDESGAVTLANAAAQRLLNVGEPDIGRPFQDLPISYRPIELRGPIDEAFRQRRSIRLNDQEYRLSGSETIRLTIDVRPLYRPDGSPHAVLLAFSDTTHSYALQRELETAQENLENSIEELQSANEELETTNEELQSTNEELETTNEELQSTNEELETLNEEARSSNEEGPPPARPGGGGAERPRRAGRTGPGGPGPARPAHHLPRPHLAPAGRSRRPPRRGAAVPGHHRGTAQRGLQPLSGPGHGRRLGRGLLPGPRHPGLQAGQRGGATRPGLQPGATGQDEPTRADRGADARRAPDPARRPDRRRRGRSRPAGAPADPGGRPSGRPFEVPPVLMARLRDPK
ncbi:MAG: PAS domain-containing protein, partial [Caulobacter sp.]|nr:PAS domain-containing protein [Caulobacter sp.]